MLKSNSKYKVIFTIIGTGTSFVGLQAQEFQGMAVYESKRAPPNISPNMQKMIEERMKKMLEKTFLNFDKLAAIYREEKTNEQLVIVKISFALCRISWRFTN